MANWRQVGRRGLLIILMALAGFDSGGGTVTAGPPGKAGRLRTPARAAQRGVPTGVLPKSATSGTPVAKRKRRRAHRHRRLLARRRRWRHARGRIRRHLHRLWWRRHHHHWKHRLPPVNNRSE